VIPDGTYTAVVDEFEDSVARLELQATNDDAALHEMILERSRLPMDGREVGAVLTIEVNEGDPVAIEYDPDETKRRRESVRERFDRLSQRPSDDE
jgi:hypothetical protein